ncbi:MAG TPA: glycosyltransferase [Candidatus Didemnitutus sp.]|nr:glycosyltransferase [Candidatus Didemnitutus sp.]
MKLRRVFALVPDCHVAGWRYGEVWRKHFQDGLHQAGLTVLLPHDIDFAWARPPQHYDASHSAAARARASEQLKGQILGAEGGPPQAVFSCCFSHDVEPALVDEIRAAGIPWINFFCDSLYAFDRVAELASHTSLNWFVESQAAEQYRRLGVPYLCAPYALNPDHLPDASCDRPDHGLLFVGAANRRRIRSAALIRLFGADLQVRGWNWPEYLRPKSSAGRPKSSVWKRAARLAVCRLLEKRSGGYLDEMSLLSELRRSAVILGLNQGGIGPDAASYLKLRDLEFPGLGCCCLTQYHRDLDAIFDLQHEIATFRSPWEAARIARDLARHPSRCREIGRRARARVLAEHTWSSRLAVLETRL